MLSLVLTSLLAQSVDAGLGALPEDSPPAPPPPVVVDGKAAPPPADAGQPETTSLTLRGAAEAAVAVLPSGTPTGGLDAFVALRPVVGFSAGEDFQVELGPTFRLRLVDTPPAQRANDFSGVLRWQDWDQPSNFGQLIQKFRIAPDTSPFFLRVGPVQKKTLGLGHVINRYSNQDNPDYHPAAGTAFIRLGPVRGEFFASDVFGARLLGGEVAWDLGGTFGRSPELKDRFVLAFDLVHDAARAGQAAVADPASWACDPEPCGGRVRVPVAPPATLLELDGSAVLVRSQAVRLMVVAGFGSRANQAADLGLLLGLSSDATVSDIGLSARIEVRKQAGGFRQGFFGPSYELARFAGTGLSGAPLAYEALPPDSVSLYGELRTAIGTAATLDAALEYFTSNRVDLDASASLVMLDSWLVASLRFTGVGIGHVPRYSFQAVLRWRLFPSFYVLGSGGTVFFPQPDGTLVRGVTVTAGAGVDFER